MTAWLGNTPKIAMKHFLKVTDEDFRKAMQNPVQSNDNWMQNPVQQGKVIAAQTRTEPSRNDTSSCETRACASLCASEHLDAGIISPTFYTTLVFAAILTSQMAGAWLDYVLRRGWPLLTPVTTTESAFVSTQESPPAA